MDRRILIVIAAVIAGLLAFPLIARVASKPNAVATGPTTALHQAAAEAGFATIQKLVQEGADINVPDEQGRTPLHHAAEHGHMQTVAALLEIGADPNRVDVDGKTPYDVAMEHNNGQTAGVLERAMDPALLQARRTAPAPLEPKEAESEQPQDVKSEDVNARDEQGKTALHRAAEGGRAEEAASLLKAGADGSLRDNNGKTPFEYALENQHGHTASVLQASAGMDAIERTFGGPVCCLKSEHVHMYAPKAREEAANVVLPYLVRAYDELYRIVGVHTESPLVIFNLPKGHPGASGGTSNCVILYDDTNLDLAASEEWNQYRVPHIRGYIEEMAHNFVGNSQAQFGWEMIGWTIGSEVTMLVAGNPLLEGEIARTRQGQAETFQRYVAAGGFFPEDLSANQVDRIHAYILWQCEQQYGPRFWPDFFAEIRREAPRFKETDSIEDSDERRNTRYQITLDCFDRLPGLNFKQYLAANQISLTRDVKSLHPTDPNWNRRLQ